jgi:hypothetical protein
VFPRPGVLAPTDSTTTAVDMDMADDDEENENDGDPDTSDASASSPYIDQEKYPPKVPEDEQADALYYKNKDWLANFRSTTISFLRLYIFVDKYNIHQLRDDIMTAFVALVMAWGWWLNPDKEPIQFAYPKLSNSSKFLKFYLTSAVYCWLPERDGDCATKVCEMWICTTTLLSMLPFCRPNGSRITIPQIVASRSA